MPQMSPMNWAMLMTLFLLSFMVLASNLFTSPLKTLSSTSSYNSLIPVLLWTW